MENGIWSIKKREEELTVLVSCNQITGQFGLSLTREEAGELAEERDESLKKYGRVEFGKGILDKIIYQFCDSDYIYQEKYLETLIRLQEMFYEFKRAAEDRLSDDELLNFMKEQFETVCTGDLDYLEDTCLERFAAAVRAGYGGYKASEGRGEYEKISEEVRWDKNLYQEVLKELFW
ncbi:DUF6323 family protein [Qiania dongpingensis]|uniref:Uncharacterized protein n=1 Tax=Qiania dongpingensis TaxID=2763669 RepID=A0A7G9G7Z9_9FIRM|nr:DUF6323 family protein [Qiania dongpingensis]QNM06931.1 hypothetical protein H9Q78_02030 [Qiania dongpingensis]